MFCPECGTKNQEDARFCENCGTSLAEYMEESVEVPEAQPAACVKLEPEQTQYVSHKPEAAEKLRQAPARVPKKTVSKALIAAVIEGVLAVCLLIGVFKVMEHKFSPETAALEYWKAEAAHEWSQAYEYCDFPENSFLTKQMYVNAKAGQEEEILQYKSVNARETDYPSEDTDTKSYTMEYLVRGSADKEYDYLTLTKTGRKRFLFWDEWKVASSDSWCRDVGFQLPADAVLTLNGMEVTGAKEEMDGRWKYVSVPYLFTGTYQMEVTAEGMEPFCTITAIHEYGCDDSYVELVPSEETLQAVLEQASGDFKKIMDSAWEGNDFSEIQECFSKEALSQGDVQRDYENLMEIRGNGVDTGVASLDIDQVVCKITGDYGIDYINVNVQANRTETYYQYWFQSLGELNGTVNFSFYYTKEGDSWKLMYLPVNDYDF